MRDFKYYLDKVGEVGVVERVTKSVIYVKGLPLVKPYEIVLLETGEMGEAMFIHDDRVEVLLFSQSSVAAGTRAARTNEQLSVPVSEEMLGLVMDPLGTVLSSFGNGFKKETYREINMDSPGIEARKTIKRPLETGVSIVDMLTPLGCGQRELIIGDRKVGKTRFAVQAIITQAKKGTVCILGLIGKRMGVIKEIEEHFKKNEVMDKVVMVVSGAQDPAGLIYLTPYAAIAIAEYFRDKGRDCLVVLDDLTAHAKFYRQICLLAKRFPGRDCYPVDIFFAHAGIMEKGGNFKTDGGETSITIMPVAETASGDLSGYIQTNLMSMTDGHLFFDREMFLKGQRPCVNPFLSVTRVGRQAQTGPRRELTKELLAFLARYEKLQTFVHFGAELTAEVKADLAKGEKIMKFFEQSDLSFVPADAAFDTLTKLLREKTC